MYSFAMLSLSPLSPQVTSIMYLPLSVRAEVFAQLLPEKVFT